MGPAAAPASAARHFDVLRSHTCDSDGGCSALDMQESCTPSVTQRFTVHSNVDTPATLPSTNRTDAHFLLPKQVARASSTVTNTPAKAPRKEV